MKTISSKKKKEKRKTIEQLHKLFKSYGSFNPKIVTRREIGFDYIHVLNHIT